MLLLWWCLFKIQKEKRKGLQFTSPEYFSLLLTPLRIRKLVVAGSFHEKFPDPTKWYGFDRSWPLTRFEGSERMVCTFESTKCLEVEVEYLESVVWYLQERNLSFCYYCSSQYSKRVFVRLSPTGKSIWVNSWRILMSGWPALWTLRRHAANFMPWYPSSVFPLS